MNSELISDKQLVCKVSLNWKLYQTLLCLRFNHHLKVFNKICDIEDFLCYCHLTAFYLRHIKYVIHKRGKISGWNIYFLKTVINLFCIVFVSFKNTYCPVSHSLNCIYRRPNLMWHAWKEFWLCLAGKVCIYNIYVSSNNTWQFF